MTFITEAEGGLAYIDVDEVIEGLMEEVTIVKVDMAEYWESKREELVLPHLVPALIEM